MHPDRLFQGPDRFIIHFQAEIGVAKSPIDQPYGGIDVEFFLEFFEGKLRA